MIEIIEIPTSRKRPLNALRRKGLPKGRLLTKTSPRSKNKRSRGKEKSLSKLVKELDAVVSKWVRYSHANKDGICTCYTCGHQVEAKKIHCGHYISRFYKATRWDLNNLRPQCMMDNLWKRGDLVTFRENLVKEIGLATVEKMEASRKLSFKLDRVWLIEQIDTYQQKLATL